MSKPPTKHDKGRPLSFSDLGLQTAVPKSMQQSREEKKQEKFIAKKKHQESTKKAFEALAEQQEVLKRHRQQLQEEKDAEKVVKDDRKKQLGLEADRARNQRQAKIVQQEARLLQDQQELTEEVLERQAEEARSYKEAERLIAEDIARQIKTARPAVHVPVHRVPEIQAVREKLPVHAEEQPIIEAIVDNPVVLICGETGSGKTTQVPQFLWEAGFGHEVGAPFGRDGMIAVTEPRRVAAVSMAKRVAEELNEPFGGTVCYHVRYDNNLSPDCRLKFMTEGILLKELQSDFLLSKYSVVVVDEAHERSVACDVLVGLLSRVVHLRQDLSDEYMREDEESRAHKRRVSPLKLIIMSATLRIGDFRDNAVLFPRPPPLLKVEARRFPVTAHFSRRTELYKYVQEAFKKVCQIHKKLPPGGILVFMTAQREIEMLCRMLRDHYSKTRIEFDHNSFNKHAQLKTRQESALESAAEVQEEEADSFGLYTRDYGLDGDEGVEEDDGRGGGGGVHDDFDYGSIAKEVANDINSSDDEETAEARVARSLALMERMGKKGAREEAQSVEAQLALFGDVDESKDAEWDGSDLAATAAAHPKVNSEDEENGALDTLYVLPMYALLDPRQQQRVFEAPPPGKRLCVIATNVAETSITIPNIRYVVDAGRVKTKTLEPGSQASTFKVEWTSQASAEQRAGRAGRTGPGHCYRIYSTAVFANKMPKHPTPEILRTPLESVVLLMKHLRIDHVGRFPFPTAPSKQDIEVSMRHLSMLGALDDGHAGRGKAGGAPAFRITALGSFLMQFPLAPRFAKMIFEALRVAGDRPRMVSYVSCIAAMLSTTTDTFRVGEVENFHALPQFKQEEIKRQQANQKGLLHAGSDLLTALRAFGVFAADPSVANCNKYNLVHKTMTEVLQLKKQLDAVVAKEEEALRVGEEEAARKQGADSRGLSVLQDSADAEEAEDAAEPHSARPTSRQLANEARVPYSEKFGFQRSGAAVMAKDEELQLRKIIAVGLIDQVARRASVEECQDQGYRYNDSKTAKVPYMDIRSGRILYIHPTSSTSKTQPPPEYVTYASLSKVRRRPGDSDDTDVFLTELELRRLVMQRRAAAGHSIDGAESPEVQKERLFMKGVTIMTRAWMDQIGFDEEAVRTMRV